MNDYTLWFSRKFISDIDKMVIFNKTTLFHSTITCFFKYYWIYELFKMIYHDLKPFHVKK